MSNNDTEFFLRPEAGPVPFGKLQSRPQEALKSIAEALRAAVDSATGADKDSEDRNSSSTIDRNRASRLFFVSGEPGSGKSTLYVTLRAMLSKNADYHKDYSKGYENYENTLELKGLIDGLRGDVRWLEPIDLEVVGDKEENLLAAVLERLIQELGKSSSGFSSACNGAIKKLEELAADIGMAWESNLPARAGELDPDSYSMEVMRTQRARLGVNERLRTALEELAKNDCYGCKSSTLFVLPVDDLYLKPDASLQLLRLLRMISVPRLFFLIMGDITTVEALFTEKALADWTSVAGAEVFQILPDRLNDALARARELRARFLRKLLPPGQRAEIQPMDWYEAISFSPERLNAKTLGDWLVQVELDEPWKPTDKATSTTTQPADEHTSTTSENNYQGNLFDFLTCCPLPGPPPSEERKVVEKVEELKNNPEQRKSREAYTGLQLLDATPREIMDLWSALQGFIKERRKNSSSQSQGSNATQTASQGSGHGRSNSKIPLLSLVLEFVRLSVDEQNFLNEKEQDAVLYGVLPTRRYYDPDTYLKMDRLRLEPDSSDWKVVSKDKLWLRKHLPWRLKVNPLEEEKARPANIEIREEGWHLIVNAKGPVEQKTGEQDEGIDGDKSSQSGTQQTHSEFNMLPPRPTAWLVLLHDLAWMWRPGSINRTLIDSLRLELKNKLFDPHILDIHEGNLPSDFPGWAVIRDGSTYKIFQVPEFNTVRELDCFLRVWNRGLEIWFPELEDAEKPPKSEEEGRLLIQLLWLFAGWTVIEDRYCDFARHDVEWFEQGLKTDFTLPSKRNLRKEAALDNQDTKEEWKLKLVEFRAIPEIKEYLSQLLKAKEKERFGRYDTAQPPSFQTKLSFANWINKPTQGNNKTINTKSSKRRARKTGK